jgi:tetratricopeptide (TPR) repeat protein
MTSWGTTSKKAGLRLAAVLLAVMFPFTSHADQLEGQAEYSLLFGHHVPESVARRIAATTAWLDALAKTTEALSAVRLLQWGARDTQGRQALASVVLTPGVRSTRKGQQVSVQVRMSATLRTVEDRLRKMLHEPEALELCGEMLRLEREKAEEARGVIERPGALRRGMRGLRASEKARVALLADQLEALWLLRSLVPQREGGRWRDPGPALPVLRQAAALDPDYAPLRRLLGEVLLQLDRPQDALAELDRALTLHPECAGALYTRGLAHLRLQLPTLAERDFSTALAYDASHAAWWRARGALRMIRSESGPMCEDFTRACALGDCEGLAVARERGLCLAE